MPLVSSADLAAWVDNASGVAASNLLVAAEARSVVWLETQTGRRLRHDNAYIAVLDGPGTSGPLLLPSPITEADPFYNTTFETRGSTDDTWTEIDPDLVEIEWDRDFSTHQLWLVGESWPHGRRLVRVTYQTGYGTGVGEAATPGDLSLAVLEMVAAHWQGRFKAVNTSRASKESNDFSSRMKQFVSPVVHRYRNPYRGSTELERMRF